LEDLNARSFHAGVGPGGVTDFVNSRVFQNAMGEHNVIRVLYNSLRYFGSYVSD
jgi:hypothetical protein